MLKISKSTFGYEGKPVLEFAGIDLPQGEHCLLSGASGSGKTTLLYSIAGINKPLQGNIIINNTDITTLSESQRDNFRGKNIGIIFQTLHLVKSLSVLDNLILSSYLTNIPQKKQHALELLSQLNIADKANSLPQELSQGQAQRVAIARAVINSPSLILADEPTSSLDDKSCDSVIELIKKTAKNSNASLIISTHDSRIKSHFTNIIRIGE